MGELPGARKTRTRYASVASNGTDDGLSRAEPLTATTSFSIATSQLPTLIGMGPIRSWRAEPNAAPSRLRIVACPKLRQVFGGTPNADWKLIASSLKVVATSV